MRPARTFVRSLFMVTLLAVPHSAIAASPLTVGDGIAASCTETALQDAVAFAGLNGGGTIKFDCGEEPVTITLTAPLTIPNNATIDGGGVVTLSMLLASSTCAGFVILVDHDSTVLLKNLTFDDLGTSCDFALVNRGTLTVKNSTASHNFLSILNEGTMKVIGSVFSENGSSGTLYGAIANGGTLKVKDSVFSHNRAGGGGGAGIANGGMLTVEDSTFTDNRIDSEGNPGGAVFNTGTAHIETSVFSGNVGGSGGAIQNAGVLIVKSTIFDGNGAGPGGGGGMSNWGTVTVHQSTFSNNRGTVDGGGFFNRGEASISDSLFLSNVAEAHGGAFFNLGALRISNSTITHNTAGLDGGGIYNCVAGDAAHPFSHCAGTVRLKNTVVTGNTPNDIVP